MYGGDDGRVGVGGSDGHAGDEEEAVGGGVDEEDMGRRASTARMKRSQAMVGRTRRRR